MRLRRSPGSSRATRRRWWTSLPVTVLGAIAALGLVALIAGALAQYLIATGGHRHFWRWPRGADAGTVSRLVFGALAAIGGAVALVVGYRRQHELERSSARDVTRLYTERFGVAASQLGDNASAVRLAGVYALAALTDEWEDQRQQCVDVLCAYLRLPYTGPIDLDRPNTLVREYTEGLDSGEGQKITTTITARHGEDEVRKTIVRVTVDHLRPSAPISWSKYNFDFRMALLEDANFDGATFTGDETSFHGATFTGDETSFKRATFSGELTSFNRATFAGELTSFDGATFSGKRMSFDEATFSGELTSFGLATFSGLRTSFRGATFFGAWASFEASTFSGALTSFNRATFSGAQMSFDGATFSGKRMSFDEARFSGELTSFRGATFSGELTSFDGARFSGNRMSFDEARFSGELTSFNLATLSSGRMSFDTAAFHAGEVAFVNASLAPDAWVTFGGTGFRGGRVTRDGQDFRGWPVATYEPPEAGSGGKTGL
jgi:uncharacterized protein YjbI with pentapeptide repeats